MSFTSSFLHLDGIEFKIADSLQTLAVEELPPDFVMKDPSRLLLESEYDFSKEREVLVKIASVREAEKKMAEQEEKRKQQSLKRRADTEKQKLEDMRNQQREVLQRQRELFLEQKRRQQQDKNENADGQTSDRTSPSEVPGASSNASPVSESVSEEPPPVPPRNPFLQVGKENILTPQPAARKTQDTTMSPSHRSNQSQPVITGQAQIWVDFEDRGLDPFSNMELKTIDDMAELQTVLQNVKIDPPSSTTAAATDIDYLPSYQEATSPTFDEIPAPAETSVSHNSSETALETSAQAKPDPLFTDVTAISTQLRTIVSSGNHIVVENNRPEESSQTYENVIVVANNKPAANKLPEENSPPARSESPEFVMPENPQTLYENISITEVNKMAKKLDPPSSTPVKSPDLVPSIYDFATSHTEDGKTETLRQTFERKLSQTAEQPDPDPSAVYSVIRPKSRALKSLDRIPSPSSIQTNQVQTSFGQLNPVPPSHNQSRATGQVQNTVVPRQTRSRPEVTGVLGSGLPSPKPYFPPGGTKVLPVSFGAVSNSLSTPVLPPISSSVANEGNYMNITPGSLSTPNLTQKPTPMPRRPAVPPRDPVTTVPPAVQNFTPHPPRVSSPNGPTQPITTLGHSHLLPPYALPQSNGPSVTLSPTTAMFTNQRPTPTAEKVTPAPSTVGASFIQKSHEDRAKFAETVSKALSSLPKNPPKPVVMHKPTVPHQPENLPSSKPQSQAFSKYPSLPSQTKSLSLKSSLLAGLSQEEQEFVRNVTSMGFDIQATIRAMQKYGLDAKEVVDHLCNVQEMVEQGFPTNTVQDAFEMFENDNKSVIKYLQQASQLIDMGFKEDDVRDALKTNNNDQTKALDQLMGQS